MTVSTGFLQPVKHRLTIHQGRLNWGLSRYLGLVVSELIANSYGHAFPSGTGTISVSLHRNDSGNEATLVFADDGVGFIEAGNSKRQGVGLVRRLMQQVGGSATLQFTSWQPNGP